MNGKAMAAEMAEQPAVLERLVQRRAAVAAEVRAVVPHPLCGITLVARGSSDNAALYGRYILEMASRRPAGLTAPSIHTLYRSPVEMDGYLVVAISQSGRTPEILTVLRRLREQGARTVAIVNGAGSPLDEEAEVTVHLDAGPEVAVPATKTFTATLVALGLIAAAVGDVAWSDADIAALPGQVERLLADPVPSDRLAAAIGEGDRVLVTGRGLLLVAALETALKIRETAGILAEGISPADLRHGPIAAVGPGFPVLSFRSAGVGDQDVPELIEALMRRGAGVQVIGPDRGADCPLPSGVPAGLLPVLAVVRGQQVAAALARRRGLDPDNPAGLSKVTLTH
ncbi:MAG: SIS domain-containing protein [Candidatus Dormibacteria bacterium]|jgi:glucosamine--fructose-6-phosphate aminotransferase (isomerizing)